MPTTMGRAPKSNGPQRPRPPPLPPGYEKSTARADMRTIHDPDRATPRSRAYPQEARTHITRQLETLFTHPSF